MKKTLYTHDEILKVFRGTRVGTKITVTFSFKDQEFTNEYIRRNCGRWTKTTNCPMHPCKNEMYGFVDIMTDIYEASSYFNIIMKKGRIVYELELMGISGDCRRIIREHIMEFTANMEEKYEYIN